MNELQKLNCLCVSVDINTVHSTDWANVSKYKYLRITCYSESPGILYVIFSVDGVEKGLTHTFKIIKNKWETFKIEVLCNFIKFEFVNGTEKNNRLLINVLGRYGAFSGMIPVKNVQIEDNENKEEKISIDVERQPEEEKKEHRGKSPFRRFVERKKPPVTQNQKVDCQDARLPQLFLRGNMLVATQTNQMGIIPAPVDGSIEHILCWSGGKPMWKALNELPDNWKI